jgi:hypothetical protein
MNIISKLFSPDLLIAIEVVKSRGLIYWYLLTIALGIAGFWLPYLGLASVLLMFTLFYSFGWESVEHTTQKEAGYHFAQNFIFFPILILLSFYIYGFKVALLFVIVHRFGFCDLLFYWLTRQHLEDVWTWMAWTPLGWIKGVLSKKEVLIQSFVGILIAILSYIL